MYKILQGEMVKSGVTRKDIQRIIGVSANTVWRIFNDASRPFTLTEAKKIRDEFFPSQSIDELFA
jgi:plasmid maintenance system antidote protein VapI